MLSRQQFDRMRRLALSLAGIELLERHHNMLERRTQRRGICLEGIDALLNAAEAGELSAIQEFLGLLTTKHTGFFRRPHHFDVVTNHALQAVRQRGVARLWSAAAATGEEPWSLAIAVVEAFQCENPPIRILATDVDRAALAIAQRGEYGAGSMPLMELGRRQRFFSQTDSGRSWSIAPAIRSLVEFRPLNLAEVSWPVTGPFDAIFCRNVLIYFEAGHRYAVLERMASLLTPGGLLLLDPTEHLGTARHWFISAADGVYARRRVAAAPQRSRMRECAHTRG